MVSSYYRYRHKGGFRGELQISVGRKGEWAALSFMEIFSSDCDQKDEEVELLEAGAALGVLNAELPLLVSIFRAIPFPPFTRFREVPKTMDDFGHRAMKAANTSNPAGKGVFANIVQGQGSKPPPLSDRSIRSEATGLVMAGSGTTAITLTFLVWAVLRHPDIQLKLEQEVCSLKADYTDQDIENLPLTSAVIEEALRLYGAAPGALLRRVPKGGKVLAGYYIPEDIVVSTSAFNNHRDPDIFPDPEKYRILGPSGTPQIFAQTYIK